MKLIHKIIACALAVMMLASLAGCASSGQAMKNIKKNGKIIMATNAEFPPYEYYENDKVTGFDVELAKAIAEKLGVELVIEESSFDAVVSNVQAGKADMALAGLTITDERKALIDFSDSYITATQVIIVKGDSTVATSLDLNGKKVGVQLGHHGRRVYIRSEHLPWS